MNKLYKNSWFFVVTLVVLSFLLYKFHYFYFGLVAEGGTYYSPFLEKYVNYPEWLHTVLIRSSSFILDLFGYENRILYRRIVIIDGVRIGVGYSCYGLGVLSFLWAFVVTYPYKTIKSKLKFIIPATLAVIVLNIARIVLLGVIFTESVSVRRNFNMHHEVFNILAYLLIILMIHFWLKKSKTKHVHPGN